MSTTIQVLKVEVSEAKRKTVIVDRTLHKQLVKLKSEVGAKSVSSLIALLLIALEEQAREEGKTLEEYLREALTRLR